MCSRHTRFRPKKPNPPQCPDFSGFFAAAADATAAVADCAAVVNIARLFIYEPSFFFCAHPVSPPKCLPFLHTHTHLSYVYMYVVYSVRFFSFIHNTFAGLRLRQIANRKKPHFDC